MSPGSPRTLTTSPQMALFHRFLARWSAFWVLRPSGRPLDGGNCTTRGCDTPATHRLRASCSAKPPPLPVSSALQGPRARMGHRWVAETRQLHTRKVPRRNKSRPARAARPHFRYKTRPARAARPTSGTKLAQHEPHGPTSGTKLSLLTRNSSIWRFFCMQGEFCTVLTTKKPSRENFVPNARQSWGSPTQQDTMPHPCGGCRRDRSGGHRRVRREWRPGGPGRSTRE